MKQADTLYKSSFSLASFYVLEKLVQTRKKIEIQVIPQVKNRLQH